MRTLFLLFLSVVFSIGLYATVLEEDNFDGSSSDSWSRDDGTDGFLRLNQDHSSEKTFDFGSLNAYKEITITLSTTFEGGWESTSDYFRVTLNGTATTYYITGADGSSTITMPITLTTNLDSQGKIKINLYSQSSYYTEISKTDFVKIEAFAVVPTITPATYTLYNAAPTGTLVGTIVSSGSPDTFSILSGNIDNIFAVNSSGDITVASNNNLENNTTNSYTLEINASNATGYDVESFTVNLTNDIELTSASDNPRDFTNVPISGSDSITINGSILQIGNQLLCLNSSDGATCNAPSTTYHTQNNYNNQHQARIDTSAGAPSNNTMAKLIMEPGDKVVFARLYWSARIENVTSTQKTNAKTLKLKGPNASSYTSFTSPNAKYNWHTSGSSFDYVASADVTDYVAAQGAGEYYAGGIVATNGYDNYASWQLIVIVENPDRSLKNISIYDGFYSVYNSSASADASGFITPTGTSPFNANLFIYMGESDDGYGDHVQILKKDGVATNAADWTYLVDGANDTGDVVNASVYSPDYSGGYRSNVSDMASPNFKNVLGVDIDKLPINDKLDASQQVLSNSQTSTKIKITSTGDRFSLNMFAFETEVFVPEFCYDYAYAQQNKSFTEDNNGTQGPKLTGTVNTTDPIELSIFIKSMVDSSISIDNMSVDIDDINVTQATYIPDSTKVAFVGDLIPTQSTVTAGTTVDGKFDYIHNIAIGSLQENDYFYLYYSLNPLQTTMDMPISVTANYDLTLDGNSIEYKLKLSKDIPMCTYSNFTYLPAKGIFNVVHNNYYTNTISTPGNKYYNIPTQVTNREGNFKVISMSPTNFDELHTTSTIAAVEMIDAGAFHYTDASCKELASSISDRVWVIFDNSSSVSFDKTALQSAITNRMTNLTSTDSFYSQARENAAFRITYNSVNDLGSLIQLEKNGDNYKILNFTELVQDIGTCTQTVEAPSGSSSSTTATDQVSVACGNAGNTGISADHLAACMECLYGHKTRFVCSRDNFSIRPESFLIKINDQNQTNTTQKARLADTVSGVTGTPSTAVTQLAAGYAYNLEVNATNHLNNNASPGYTKIFSTATASTDVLGYQWSPTGVAAGCNDTNDTNLNFQIVNGDITLDSTVNQVGEYTLHMDDTTWTTVDSNPIYMAHHNGDPTYFISSDTPDCVANSSATQAVNSATKNGCNISSNHDSSGSSLKYRNYSIEFHPYKFDITGLTPTVGLNNDVLTASSYVYMADMSNSQDENMSLHLNSTISALGYNNSALTNFVGSCYAKPLDLNIIKTDTSLTGTDNNTVVYQSRFHDLNASNAIITANNVDTNETNTSLPMRVQTLESFFTKNLNGSMNTILNLNYFRKKDIAANPKSVTFTNYNIDCTNAVADCTFNADLSTNKTTQKRLPIANATVKHYYGRTHAPRHVFSSNDHQQAFIYYEVFCNGGGCDKTLLQNGTNSVITDDPRWFVNKNHNSGYGTAGTVTQKGSAGTVIVNVQPTGNHQDSTTLTYDDSKGTPYKTTMENNASSWLIYNKYDANDTTNEFDVEFGGSGGWTGLHDTNTTTNSNGADTTNRRIMW